MEMFPLDTSWLPSVSSMKWWSGRKASRNGDRQNHANVGRYQILKFGIWERAHPSVAEPATGLVPSNGLHMESTAKARALQLSARQQPFHRRGSCLFCRASEHAQALLAALGLIRGFDNSRSFLPFSG